MTRIHFLLLLAAPLLFGAAAQALTRDVRGNLIFDNIPEPAAGLSDKLDAYLNARQATPLGFSPKGQLLIATRFGDADQLHVLDKAGGGRVRRVVDVGGSPTKWAVTVEPDGGVDAPTGDVVFSGSA